MLRIRLRNTCLDEYTRDEELKQVTFQISSGHLELFQYFEFFQRYYPWNSSADSVGTKINNSIYKIDKVTS